MSTCFDAYDRIFFCDFEFGGGNGNPPEPRCAVYHEYRSGITHCVWLDGETGVRPPIECGTNDLFVAFVLTAELNCCRQLGWPLPDNCADLYVEFVRHLNGKSTPKLGRSLVDALVYFGLPHIDKFEKKTMRDLALRGGPYSEREQSDLLMYCESDVTALRDLWPHFESLIGDHKSASRAVFAGRYMKAASAMEMEGIPLDIETLNQLKNSWDQIKAKVILRVNADYGVYVPARLGRTQPNTKRGQQILKRAEELGVSASHLGQAAYEYLDRQQQALRDLPLAVQIARRKTGLTVAKIAEWERSGRDHSTYPQLDVEARELAGELPELGIGPAFGVENVTTEDLAANLWELLRHPTPTRAVKFDDALDAASQVVDSSPDADLDTPLKFSSYKFAEWLIWNDIPWPRLETGSLDLQSETFKDQAQAYPAVAKLRELRETLSALNLFQNLSVGRDGCNRTMLSPYRARTSRNQPSNSRNIFGPHVWVRNLILPKPGWGCSYIDWCQQEIAVGAALSGDETMQACYRDGDFYLNFAKACGEAPPDATRDTHESIRELYKRACLGIQYRMGERSLAQYLGDVPVALARRILRQHQETFWKFWLWSERAVDCCHLTGQVSTVFGWPRHLGDDPKKPEKGPNPRSISNHACQGNAAEMLRLAACFLVERGIRVCMPVHDAFLITAPEQELPQDVTIAQQCMQAASLEVLNGFECRTEAKTFYWPDHYSDKRGDGMWADVMAVLEEFQAENLVEVGSYGDF